MRVAVLGAGFQGTGVAIELARRGIEVDLYDRNEVCITQAGFRNEGKIHLGFTYANDGDFETAKLMAVGGMAFGGILERWIECDVASVGLSAPYEYAVHRDSLVPAERIESHFAKVVALMRELAESDGSDYLGQNVRNASFRAAIAHSDVFDPETIGSVLATPELSIDVGKVTELLRQRVAAERRIAFLPNRRVSDVAPVQSGWEVCCSDADAPSRECYDQVVNCLREGRLAIDQGAGLPPKPPWLHRLKFGVHFSLKEANDALPCTTIVLGPYGDIVGFDARRFYLSWYPSCLTGVSAELLPPDWPRELTGEAGSRMIAATIAGLAKAVVPLRGLSEADMQEVKVVGGIIFAAGRTDIDDPNSQLHTRTKVGVSSRDGYHSVNTGKYTLAPMFAMQTADRVCSEA
jgi:hypothetical protein